MSGSAARSRAPSLLLVLRVEEAEQECDRDRLHSRRLERRDQRVDLVLG